MNKFLALLAVSLFAITTAQAAEFSEVDTDGNGAITMEEAKTAMPDLTDEAFNEADADGDGSLNESEFATLEG